MSKITFVYGSGGGNTEIVCQKVAVVLEDAGHQIELLRAKLTEPEDVKNYDVLILACPTYGHGQLEAYFEKFLDKFEVADLKGKRCAVISLGDKKYDLDYLLESAVIITEFLRRKEADIIVEPLRIAMTPVHRLDSQVEQWAKKLAEML